jgi:hypothetical protein
MNNATEIVEQNGVPLSVSADNEDLLDWIDVRGYQSLLVHISGTWTGLLAVQASNSKEVATDVAVRRYGTLSTPEAYSMRIKDNGWFYIELPFNYVRIRAIDWISGKALGCVELHSNVLFPSGMAEGGQYVPKI